MSQQVGLVPDGFWLKTHFYVEGSMLHAVTYSCIAGSPEVFKASLDLRPIMAFVVKKHQEMHGQKISGEELSRAIVGCVGCDCNGPVRVSGIFDSIASVAKSAAAAVSKVGKTKLVSTIGKAVKSVVKNKVVMGGALTVASVAFPPVGLPAAAAYATASGALAAIDQAKASVAAAKKIVSKATDPKTKAVLRSGLEKWAGATLQKAVADKLPIPSNLKSTIAKAVKITSDQAKKAQGVLGQIASAAKAGNVEAQKMARVVTLAKNAQDKLKVLRSSTSKNVPKLASKPSTQLNGFPALLVTRKGQIVPGRYLEKQGAPAGVVLRGGKVYRGNFAVAGGGSRELLMGSSQSNPFLRPAGMR